LQGDKLQGVRGGGKEKVSGQNKTKQNKTKQNKTTNELSFVKHNSKHS
jgi:hypothetical protein